MAPPRKPIEAYEREARRVGECLVHKTYGVARRLYQERHGVTLPSHIAVCHTCDNPHCIDDAHHFTGTWKDNVDDAVRKGRHSCFQKPRLGKKHSHDAAAKKSISSGLTKAYASGEREKVAPNDHLTPEQRTAKSVKAWATRRLRGNT